MCRVATASSSSRPTWRRSRRQAISCRPSSPTRSCNAPGRRDTGSWRGRRCSWCRPPGSPRGTWRSTRNHLTPALSARPRPVSGRSASRDRGRRGRRSRGPVSSPTRYQWRRHRRTCPSRLPRWSRRLPPWSHLRPGRSHLRPPRPPRLPGRPRSPTHHRPTCSPQHSGWILRHPSSPPDRPMSPWLSRWRCRSGSRSCGRSSWCSPRPRPRSHPVRGRDDPGGPRPR